jgi:phosphate transport system permease protein
MTEGGIFPALLGTFLLTILTAVSSVPVGIAAAIYLVEYAREGTFIRLVRLSIRNLSGVPSVVYGLFGVGLFVHALDLGISILASGLTLGLLTLPTTITASEEALKAVPRSYRDGALALGATRWEAIQTNVLPAAAPGILTGVILGLSRAAGETAPILFTGVAFSLPKLPTGLGDQFMALPYHLYILSTQHHDIVRVRPIAFATATVLIGLVAVLNLTATYLRARARSRMHA